jgi:hypothetical protein
MTLNVQKEECWVMTPHTELTRPCQNSERRDITTYKIVLDIYVTGTTQVCIRKTPGLNRGNSPDAYLTSADLFYIFLENLLRFNYFNFFTRSEIFLLRALRF